MPLEKGGFNLVLGVGLLEIYLLGSARNIFLRASVTIEHYEGIVARAPTFVEPNPESQDQRKIARLARAIFLWCWE